MAQITTKERAIRLTRSGLSERTISGILGIDLADINYLMSQSDAEVDTVPPISMAFTFAIKGEIKVPVGEIDFIPPFFVPSSGTITKVRHKINAGTSVTCKLQKNGVDVTDFTAMSVATAAASTEGEATVAEDDLLAVIVTAVSGTPQNLSVSVIIDAD